MNRLRRLGLQRRIMLLVAVGLAAMFTVGGFFGLSAMRSLLGPIARRTGSARY